MAQRRPFNLAGPGNDHQQPQFRYWGSRRPPRERQPVRAQVTSGGDGAGTASLRIYGPIDDWGDVWGVSAAEVADALDGIDNSVKTIDVHLNTPGGDVYEGVTILNLLRQHSADTHAIVDGIAASAGSFIAAGCDTLSMAQNSQLMIHDAWGICIGPAADMHGMGDLLDRASDNIAAIYRAKAGDGIDWRAAMLDESWFTDQEAVAAGLADDVLGAVVEGDPANAFDLSMFRHRGRNAAPAPPSARAPRVQPKNAPPVPANDDSRRRHQRRTLEMTAARHGLELPKAAAVDEDGALIAQALGWMTAIDNIVDEAQEALSAYLGVQNPDADEATEDAVPAA